MERDTSNRVEGLIFILCTKCINQRKLPPIPAEGCHPDQGKAATQSERSDAGVWVLPVVAISGQVGSAFSQ